jgi:hypothetical protein
VDIETRHKPEGHTLNIITRIPEEELLDMASAAKNHLTRRWVDTLYAELLPVIRARVLLSLNALEIAKAIEGEIQMAIHDALGGK